MKLSDFLKENEAYDSFVEQFEVDFETKREFVTIGNGLYWHRTSEGSQYWIELQDKFAEYENQEFDMDWLLVGTIVSEDEPEDELINELVNESANNGGKTDYYQIDSAPFKINDFDDFAEWRNLNGNQFNMGKAMWTFNVGRHSGTTYERDLNKIIHYANRELMRLKRK